MSKNHIPTKTLATIKMLLFHRTKSLVVFESTATRDTFRNRKNNYSVTGVMCKGRLVLIEKKKKIANL